MSANIPQTNNSANECKTPTPRGFFGLGFFGFDRDFPDTEYYTFIRDAVLASLIAGVIFWIASFIADLVRYYVSGSKVDWGDVLLNAMARSIYSFISTILLFLIIR